MFTQLESVTTLKQIFTELLLNHTDSVSKVAPLSVLDGIGYGIGKLGQRAIKDIAIIESHLFPDVASGTYLDEIAANSGIAARFLDSGSSCYLRVVADPGTTYIAGTHTFTGNHGIVFQLVNNFTVTSDGFGYVKVQAITTGVRTNVDPITVNQVAPIPTGHNYVINEFFATGGQDIEDDESFQKRIKDGANILAKGTLAAIQQAFMRINNNIFRVYYGGITTNGQVQILVLTQNGIDLTNTEINNLLINSQQFFSLTDVKPDGITGYGLIIQNLKFTPIDISVRLQIDPAYNPNDVRKEAQIAINKFLDYRFFTGNRVQWTSLFGLIQATTGVRYVLDNYFSPGTDIIIPRNTLPRVRGFLFLNPDGTLISSGSNTLNPVYYPQQLDFSYQKTVFNSLNFA